MNQKIILLVFLVGLFYGTNGQPYCGVNNDVNCPLRCQNETGFLLPIATICSDQRADCELMFNCTAEEACEDPANPAQGTLGQPDTMPKLRPTACDSPALQDVALECAKTCMICCETPEYNCDDDDTGIVDCQANIAKCKDPAWVDIMSQYCPSSCGLCLEGSCTDVNAGCNGMRSLCRDVDWYDYMGTNCARTCERCTDTSNPAPGGCTDIANNCAVNSNLCTNNIYRELMQQQCCATCQGAGNGGGATCVDSNPSCSNWVQNGFCQSNFYTPAQKRQYCARSCNLC